MRTGGSNIGRRKPKKLPAVLRGTEIRNQIRSVANIVPRGTAPEECAAMRKKLRKTNVPKTILQKLVGWKEGMTLALKLVLE